MKDEFYKKQFYVSTFNSYKVRFVHFSEDYTLNLSKQGFVKYKSILFAKFKFVSHKVRE